MRYFVVFPLATSIAAIVIGCGPGKELPENVSTSHKEISKNTQSLESKVPETSDPDAKMVAEAAVDAITLKNRALLEKAKNCQVTGPGSFKFDNMVDAIRFVQSQWPDKALATFEFKDGFYPKATYVVNGSFGWKLMGTGAYVPPPNPIEISDLLKNDFLAEHWIPLGLGLADPKTVFFERKPAKTEKGTATVVKLSVKGRPVYQVTFDDQSKLPVQIEYSWIETGVTVNKVVTLTQHKAIEGLMLPTHLESKQNEIVRYRWTLEKWEFPEKLDDSIFNPPSVNKAK